MPDDRLKLRRRSEQQQPSASSLASGQQPEQEGMKGDWSQLPKELLGLIVERLILSDYIRFGAVCCSWRSVTASKHHRPATELPWSLLAADDYPFNDVNEFHTKKRHRHHILSDDYPFNDVKEFYRPSKKKLHDLYFPETSKKRICGSFQGWFIMTDPITNYFLLNPLTRLQIPLPSWPSSPKELQSLPRYISKAVMSASPSSPSCLVAAISYYGGMAFCQPKGNTWTLFNDKEEHFHYQDLIFHKGALYAIDGFGELCVFEFDEYPKCRTVLPPLNWYSMMHTHLVECNGELLAVLRYAASLKLLVHPCVNSMGFQIYRADLGERKWVEVNSLGDQALFIQCKYSLEGFKGDCIYYKGWPKEEAKVNEIQTRRILHSTGRVFPRIWIVPTPWELEAES